MNGNFEALRGNTNGMQIDLNVPSNDYHVPAIERYTIIGNRRV